MSNTPLDFKLSDLGTIKTEVDAGLAALIGALEVAEKFTVFIPNVHKELALAVTVLTEIKTLVDKL